MLPSILIAQYPLRDNISREHGGFVGGLHKVVGKVLDECIDIGGVWWIVGRVVAGVVVGEC